MRLVVVGSAGSFPGPDSAASCYLVQAEGPDGAGGTRTWNVLLDLGNGALGPLQRHLAPADLDAVAISHLHADHVADVVVLGVMLRYDPRGARPTPLPLHGPEGVRERLAQLSGHDPATSTADHLALGTWRAGEPVRVGPLTIEPVPVEHPVPAFGFRVTGPSEADPARTVTLAYTGDTDECPGLDELAADADLLLAEAAYLESTPGAPRGVHLTGRRAGLAAQRNGSRRLLLTHLVAWNDPAESLAEAAAAYDGPLDLARPGTVVAL
ncbi:MULTISPECIES: MBL fold metallo-hydrolase [unclassified Cellulomonas]|jgi:ribonuclease BN (tRNA processing enzyme)|uniref:MBL fold metallo-hydrolase n=1 Tax=unclassified Cellulomonas TaxID=2620175 RepID=UPI001C302BD5|nr:MULTISPECIES: MBL fold metallo-hydrolase [unclassified Cellulomonas]MBW0253677.1 MBL fold metallo-hydrolase [Cellulomonas sp. PS-H5]